MLINKFDSSYGGSEQMRVHFWLAAKVALGFLALIWLIQLINWALALGLERFGIVPRQFVGLQAILYAPMLHAGFDHLVANSLPLLVLITVMLYVYSNSALRVLPAVYLGSGLAVWLFARSGMHVGASGMIYGLVSYIFVAGLIRRDMRAIAASMLVYFLYGGLAWGVLPIKPGVSWETHLAAALIGVWLAIMLRRLDIPPRTRYSWEAEGGEHEDPQSSHRDIRRGS